MEENDALHADHPQRSRDPPAAGESGLGRAVGQLCHFQRDPSTATTIRVRNGETLTVDGPFAETKEWMSGYYILECDHLDQALAAAAMVPSAKYGSVEVRPVAEM
jgi:hypothetical protein